MADAMSQNEVFDELSRTFKEGSSQDTLSLSSADTSSPPRRTPSFVGKPKDQIPELIRYKEWLGMVKSAYEAAEAAKKVADVIGGQDEVKNRVHRLQQDLLEKSTMHSVKELALHRMQLGDALLNIVFPPPDEEGTISEGERQQFIDLCIRQNELSSDILAHHSACQRVQEELDDVRQQSLEAKKSNRQLMDQVQLKIEEKRNQAKQSASQEGQRLQAEIDRLLSYICIGRNILQGLIVGSGVHWAEDEELQELLISLGQPVKL